MPRPIFVFGSSNTDMVVKAAMLPRPGETVLGGAFLMNHGGKGANQAVSAARLGGQVTFVAQVGNDIFGKEAVAQFHKEGIDTRFIQISKEQPSGVALIMVDQKGENSISVAPGANAFLTIEYVSTVLDQIKDGSLILIQLEIPISTVEYIIESAHPRKHQIILNPAPAALLDPEVYKFLYLITPNEKEAEHLTGVTVTDDRSAIEAADRFHKMGLPNVIITRGARGALLSTPALKKTVPAPVVNVADTTAAGDVFNGALAVALAEGNKLEDAVEFANSAAAISVTRLGAQTSAPYRHEVVKSVFN